MTETAVLFFIAPTASQAASLYYLNAVETG